MPSVIRINRRSFFPLLFVTGCLGAEEGRQVQDVEWEYYAGDAGGTKYSNAAQINKSNVKKLVRVWTTSTGDYTDSGVGGRHDFRFETTPIMRDGTLYVATPLSRVFALDPASGREKWRFDPNIAISASYPEGLTSRGVSYWRDTSTVRSLCQRRIFVATVDARLFSIDANSGRLCLQFGNQGVVNLHEGPSSDGTVTATDYSVTSPVAVIRDLVVVGSTGSKNSRATVPSATVRAYDARTGALRWKFVPGTNVTSKGISTVPGANVWSIISVDENADRVFVPVASAAPDFYGANRPGDNRHANSVVALSGSSGEVLWAYQVVHHDLWDYDVAAQPLLIRWSLGGKSRDAVVIGTKMGMIFVLDAKTGEPLLPVHERSAPSSDVPDEVAASTQPHSTLSLHGTRLTPDSAFGITEDDRAWCRNAMKRLRNEGIYTPPSLEGTLVWPGFWGGINWSGIAWDPQRQMLITTLHRLAMIIQLQPRDSARFLDAEFQARRVFKQEGTPYLAARMPFVAPTGIPCSPPPWSLLMAVDLSAHRVAWQVPLGFVPGLTNHADHMKWGAIAFGGPLVTAGGLVFIGATQDNRFRAFDIDSGELLWEHSLPAGGQAAPMTYVHDKRQFVVIVAGGRAGVGTSGDFIVAFAVEDTQRP